MSTTSFLSLLTDAKSHIQDILNQIIPDPQQQQGHDPSAQSSLARNLLHALLYPWAKTTPSGRPHGTLAKWAARTIWGVAGVGSLILLREFLLLKRREKNIRDSVVLITGGASGIGRMLAEKLALHEDCRVVIWDVSESLLEATVSDIERQGGSIRGYRVDVTNQEEVHRITDVVRQEVGNVNILINNAGIVGGKPFLQSDDQMMQKVMHVNAISHFWTVKAFLPYMSSVNSGHIVSIASAAALVGVPRMSDYAASKAAAFGFMESLRLELKQSTAGVRTTIVCPFYINTGMFEGVKTRFPKLLPILSPHWTTEKIIRGIKRNEELIVLPRFIYSVFFFRLFFPVWLQDTIGDFFGITHSMDTFKGIDPEDRANRIPDAR